MAERGQAVLSLVSRVFLKDRKSIIDRLDHADERLIEYVVQQVNQFRTREGFALEHAHSQYLEEVENDLLAKIMEWAPVEQRVRGLSPGDRVRGLTTEELAAALSKEDAARLRELLGQKANGTNGG